MTKSIRIDLEAEEEIAHAIDRYETEREASARSSGTSCGLRSARSKRLARSAAQ